LRRIVREGTCNADPVSDQLCAVKKRKLESTIHTRLKRDSDYAPSLHLDSLPEARRQDS
jgi:hypothetical protein